MRFVLAAILACIVAHSAKADMVAYSQDFESGVLGPEFSGAGSIQSTHGLSAYGFGSLHLKNDSAAASVLTLTGLAEHTSMSLSFSLAMWDSIDYGTDIFQVQIDGGFVINETFGNYFPPSGSEGPGVQITPPTNGAFTHPDFGYSPDFRDSARAVIVTFAHSAPTVTISFQFPNSQTAPDEAFGIDNVTVSTNGTVIPEPSSLVSMAVGALGLAGFGWFRRRPTARS